MHPVARVSINKYRNLRTQQMLVHSLVCIFPRHVSAPIYSFTLLRVKVMYERKGKKPLIKIELSLIMKERKIKNLRSLFSGITNALISYNLYTSG
jgi:hypothetical protein